MITILWSELKSFYASNSSIISLNYIEFDSRYFIWTEFNNFKISCPELYKGTDDAIDFESNYKSISNISIIKIDTDNIPIVTSKKVDSEDRPLSRNVITDPSFRYSPRSLDFYTAKYGSLYNRSHFGDGTIDGAPDLGDAWLKYYDADNVELVKGESETIEDFQIRITANCTKTVMYFEPSFNYDVIGAKLQFRNVPTDRSYFWFVAAPLVPVEYGGNVVFMGGGMNISFFNERDTFECDGKSVSKIFYDGTYHSGMVALIVKHNVGVQIGIQLIYQFYSA
jgi:hypothetical protein